MRVYNIDCRCGFGRICVFKVIYKDKNEADLLMGDILIQRIYDHDIKAGCHILVDRLWPRGIRKDAVSLDSWYKEIAPTPELRKWFAHSPERFEEFTVRYVKELDENPKASEFIDCCRQALSKEDLILLYAAKDTRINHATVLKDWLSVKLRSK